MRCCMHPLFSGGLARRCGWIGYVCLERRIDGVGGGASRWRLCRFDGNGFARCVGQEAFKAERPVLLCAVLEVAGVVGVWALGIAVSGFLPYGAARIVLVAGVAVAMIAWVVLAWRAFRARFGVRCNVVLLRGRVISSAIVVAVAMLACAAIALGVVRFSSLAIDVTAGPEDIEASIVEVDAVKRGGDARKGGFSGEATEVDFAEVRGGVGQSALHRIELASTDDDEVEFFSTCAAGDRISIVFYPRTETLVTAEPL